MKRLFKVVDSHTKKTIEYFSNKIEAKATRNSLNPERGDDFIPGTKERYYIAKGPDHRLYKHGNR